MHGNTDSPCLIRNGPGDRLTDPPCSIGRKLVSFPVIKFFHGFDQTQISFLDQIQEEHASSYVSFGNTDYQTKISFCQTLFRIFISILHSFSQADLFVSGEKWNFSDFFQIHTDRIFNADSLRYRQVDILHIYLILFAEIHFFFIAHDQIVHIIVLDTQHIHTVGFQIIKNLVHMFRIQRKILEEVIDLLVFQYVFLFLRQLDKFCQFLAEFCHVHFHKCSILSILNYMVSSIKGNIQCHSASFQIFQSFPGLYDLLESCQIGRSQVLILPGDTVPL